jgi:D-xylose transport system substrate-binding protein
MKSTLLNRILILLGALFLFACASSRETLAPGERVVLGLLLDTTDGGPWGREGAALVEKAQAAGFEVLVRTAEGGGREVQERQARELIKAGAQLLVAIPSAPDFSAPPPEGYRPLSIPVIAFGELIPGLDPDLLVGPDLEAAGYLQARTIRERIPGRGVVLLGGPEDNSGASRLRDGQLRAFAEWEELRGEETGIAADLRLDDPSAREARLRTAEELARPVRTREAISAIIAFDDELAGGAAAAVGEEKLAGRILVAGRGGELAACRRIIEGSQLLTVYTPPDSLVAAAVSSAIRLFRGMDPGEIAGSLGFEEQRLEHNGKEVPAVLLAPVPVTRATMIETVILDGLYPIEAVYGEAPPE